MQQCTEKSVSFCGVKGLYQYCLNQPEELEPAIVTFTEPCLGRRSFEPTRCSWCTWWAYVFWFRSWSYFVLQRAGPKTMDSRHETVVIFDDIFYYCRRVWKRKQVVTLLSSLLFCCRASNFHYVVKPFWGNRPLPFCQHGIPIHGWGSQFMTLWLKNQDSFCCLCVCFPFPIISWIIICGKPRLLCHVPVHQFIF